MALIHEGGFDRHIAAVHFLDCSRASSRAVPHSPLIFVEVNFEAACLAVNILELGDEHIDLLQKLSDIGRFAELYSLDKSVFKLCTKDLSSFDFKERIANNN